MISSRTAMINEEIIIQSSSSSNLGEIQRILIKNSVSGSIPGQGKGPSFYLTLDTRSKLNYDGSTNNIGSIVNQFRGSQK